MRIVVAAPPGEGTISGVCSGSGGGMRSGWRRRLFQIGLLMLVVGAAIATTLQVVHLFQMGRLRRIAATPAEAYVVQRAPILVLDHVRVIDGTGKPAADDQRLVISAARCARRSVMSIVAWPSSSLHRLERHAAHDRCEAKVPERPWTSPLLKEHREGTFLCAGCALPFFSSKTKLKSGTGWPSFYAPLPEAVETTEDHSFLMLRTEVHCRRCGGHLGHVFDD